MHSGNVIEVIVHCFQSIRKLEQDFTSAEHSRMAPTAGRPQSSDMSVFDHVAGFLFDTDTAPCDIVLFLFIQTSHRLNCIRFIPIIGVDLPNQLAMRHFCAFVEPIIHSLIRLADDCQAPSRRLVECLLEASCNFHRFVLGCAVDNDVFNLAISLLQYGLN